MSRSPRQVNQPTLLGNRAESLLELARRVRRRIRQRAGVEAGSKPFEISSDYCQLALQFVSSSDVLKLRALVEDWSIDRIASELGSSVPQCSAKVLAPQQP